ncbi:MAG: nitrate reductase cytochrome c-type subunit [Rhodobiaceae bacterium]|nr:nitrate reductase cytochrome c-type subunit [Rhodobiaceae bacterium]MCC0014467.1 nitrate reductase cytochrome c-type subunit [Rhodobiaceae bacterium]MCC0062246.1 nitrate reductase cytochrome c-type subunit [Rhodobiaceae bacterium]
MRLLPTAVLVSTAISLAAGFALAQTSGASVRSLRGVQVDEPVGVEDVFQQEEKRFVRNYRQQPPLIPHSIDQYQIDRNANQCLSCHDWTNAGDRGAPTLSMTHYLDRDGNQLDTVAGTRWFCNQCHVPQADAPTLISNTFESSGN